MHGRAAICGMISQYNATEPTPAPRNLAMVIGKRLRLQGLLVSDHSALQPQFVRGGLRLGPLRRAEVRRDQGRPGIENGVEAFLGLLRGENTGKMIVSLDD